MYPKCSVVQTQLKKVKIERNLKITMQAHLLTRIRLLQNGLFSTLYALRCADVAVTVVDVVEVVAVWVVSFVSACSCCPKDCCHCSNVVVLVE